MGKKGKKKDKGLPPPGLKLLPEEENMDLTLQIETLERELLVKTRMEEKYRSEGMKLRDKVEQMQNDFKQEQNTTFAVTADMARQYKALQEDLIHKINALETTLTEQKEELDMTNHELKELIRDKDDIIAHKEHIIAELKNRMEAMCTEFHDMLNTTLKLMKDHMAAKLTNREENSEESEKALRNQQEEYAARLQEYSAKAYSAVSAGGAK